MKTIKQISKDQVMNFLLNDKPVYRMNIENESLTNLTTKSIQVIKRDARNDCYLYFTLEDDESSHSFVTMKAVCPCCGLEFKVVKKK